MSEQTSVERDDPNTGTRRPFSWVLITQLVAYIILFVLAAFTTGDQLHPSSLTFSLTTTAVVAMIVIYAFFNPLQTGIPGRIVGLVCGFASMFFATTPLLGNLVFHDQQVVAADGEYASAYIMPQAWLAGAGCLLVVVTVAGFACQMAREKRTHLITSLSASILDGVASIAAAGWCFLPAAFTNSTVVDFNGNTSLHVAWLIGIIAIVVVAVCLCCVSYLWNKDATPATNAHCPWLGVGLTPVMFTGAIVAIAALINALC